ncbi:MAG: energy transducer TonB [Candidatus Aminicenantes bacterium]|jgi:TonB family protein
MTAIARSNAAFKRAVFISFTAHLAIFLLAVISPRLPKPPRKGMIHYVNVVSFPGGGGPAGGGGGEENIAETPLPKRETLRDLTTQQKVQQEPDTTFRHPVDKPKKETKPKTEKKVSIQKPQPVTKKTPPDASAKESSDKAPGKGPGTGSGVRIGGGGSGTGGSGSGSGAGSGSAFSSQIGLSNFPFTYYLQNIINRVSGNWFTSLVDPGITGSFQVTVHFRIQKNGQVSDLKVQETSGIRSLDMSALRAIQSSTPFPPLPRAYEEDYLGIYLIFEHSK